MPGFWSHPLKNHCLDQRPVYHKPGELKLCTGYTAFVLLVCLELLFTEFHLNRSGQQLFGLCSSLSIFLSVWLLQMPFIVISSTFKSTVLSPWWHQSHGHSCKPLLIVQMCCGFRQPSSSQLLASTLHCLLPSGLKGEKSSNLWVEIRTVQ